MEENKVNIEVVSIDDLVQVRAFPPNGKRRKPKGK